MEPRYPAALTGSAGAASGMATVWGLAPGDWATWAGSLFVAASFAFLALGTFKQLGEAKRQRWLDESAQAREVGAWIDFLENTKGMKSGDALVRMSVQNSSTLPVRRVHGYLFAAAGDRCDPGCVRVYSYIDRAIGPNGTWAVDGATDIADKISMQAQTVMRHAKHLASYGLIRYERAGQGRYRFRILHNPARGWINADASIPAPSPRARKVSQFAGKAAPDPRKAVVEDPRESKVTTLEDRRSKAVPRPSLFVGTS